MHSCNIFFKNKTLYKLWARFIRKRNVLLTRDVFQILFLMCGGGIQIQLGLLSGGPSLLYFSKSAPICHFMPQRFIEPALGDEGKWGTDTHKGPPAAGNRRHCLCRHLEFLMFPDPPDMPTVLHSSRGRGMNFCISTVVLRSQGIPRIGEILSPVVSLCFSR